MVRPLVVVVLMLCSANGYLAMAWQTNAPSKAVASDDAKQAVKIFQLHCVQCHGPSKQQGKLRLDQPSSAMVKVVNASKSDASVLLERITNKDQDHQMPPQGARLSNEEVATLRHWISQGATWPTTITSAKEHWSFQSIRRPPLSPVKDQRWVHTPIDTFVLHRLDKLTIKPAPEADRPTLIRRLYLDLCGTLPAPEVVDAFVANKDAQAYEVLVDGLLKSPQYGERWGRHWLDLARYADSDGLEHDEPRPYAHLFREWVIDAYNSDMPYDQFTIEQLAGDLLPTPKKEQLIASGFHRQTQKHNTAEMFNEEFRIKVVKDRVNTTGMTWMGMTVGCAECHDHKYDPLSQREYYQLYAFFNDANELEAPGNVATFHYKMRPTHVQTRGNPQKLGEEVHPGTPAVLPPSVKDNPRATRLDLARWLVQKDHPLTARVEANRIWQHLFGSGLVQTPDDFGLHGMPPLYLELLDWLAAELQSNGWGRKKLIKTIVCSATYRQSSRHRPELASSDPSNRLLARQNRFRVEAEIIHDISLQAAGILNTGYTGGTSFQQLLPRGLDIPLIKNNKLLEPSDWDERHRRGIYLQVQRTYQHPLLMTFDAPDGNQSCACRDRQATPAQALSLLNDPLFREAAYELGLRLKKHEGSIDEKLQWGYRLCFGRVPQDKELKLLHRLIEQQQLSQPESPWAGVAAVLLNIEAFTTRE